MSPVITTTLLIFWSRRNVVSWVRSLGYPYQASELITRSRVTEPPLMKNPISGTSLPHARQVASDFFIVSCHHSRCALPSMVPGGLALRGLGILLAPNDTVSGGLPLLAVLPASRILTRSNGTALRGSKN